MTRRHQFLPGGGEDGQLCLEKFGGVAACALPRANDWHWGDDQHPYWPGVGDGLCVWWTAQNVRCGEDSDSPRHATDRGEEPKRIVVDFVTPPQELPATYSEVVAQADAAIDQVSENIREGFAVFPQYGGDSPDGGDAEHLGRGYTVRDEDGPDNWGVRGMVPEPKTEPVNTGDQQPEWSRASEWLEMPGTSMEYGPWPVRKYVLRDLECASGHRALLRALDALEVDYAVLVVRPEGAPYREALVTWDVMLGLSLEQVCDELAAQYG